MKTLPELSVIIPAYNEEDFLPTTLSSLREAISANEVLSEVIVVDNNSTDKTAEIAESFGAHVVFERINQISRARNRGAEEARGKYFLFLDADSIVSERLLMEAISALRGKDYPCGGALVEFDEEIGWLHRKGLNLWNMISKRFKLAAGCFIFCERPLFFSVGGFSHKYFAGEELFFCRHVKKYIRKKQKDLLIITSAKTLTSARKLKWHSLCWQIFLFASFLVFPFAIKYKSLCSFWYKRPEK